MESITALLDTLATDPVLAQLDPAGATTIIELLALVMGADRQASILERGELEDLVVKLPFFEGKPALAEQAITAALAKMTPGQEGWVIRAAADATADKLTSKESREKVYAMAARLAQADLRLEASERRALTAVAEAFGLDAATAARLEDSAAG